MSEPQQNSQEDVADALQFATVEPVAGPGTATVCVACKRPIVSEYFSANGKVFCARCRNAYAAAMAKKPQSGSLLRAVAYGVGAGAVGAAIWYGVMKLTGYQFGLIAIAVGYLVGTAVRIGSGKRGGRGYQILAVFLTYYAIGISYMPEAVAGFYQGLKTDRGSVATGSSGNAARASETQSARTAAQSRIAAWPKPLRLVISWGILVLLGCVIALIVPVVVGINSPIFLLLFGFALWEAWKLNIRRVVQFSGPFAVAARRVAPPPLPGALS